MAPPGSLRKDPTEDSRTTSSNAWKPPPSDGTVSEQRAKRWQQSPGGGSVPSGERRSPALPKTSPPVKVVQVKDADVKELADLWCPSSPQLVAGKLRNLHAASVRPGMSHPPQNPKVQRELLAYLQAYGVKPRKASPTKSAPSSAERERSSQGSRRAHSSGQAEHSSSVVSKTRSNPALRQKQRGAKSPRASKHRTRRTTSSMSALTARMEGDSKLAQLSEDQISRRMREFRSTSRSNGWELGNRSMDELSELTQFHNKSSRTKVQMPQRNLRNNSSIHVEQLRDLRYWLSAPRQSIFVDGEPSDIRPRTRGSQRSSSPLVRMGELWGGPRF